MIETREIYRGAVEKALWAKSEPVADVAYGKQPRQKLDLYSTDRPKSRVLLFVHGGGFVAGDKASDPVFYGNVPRYFSHHGYLGVAMNYRLAPNSIWPAGSEGVAAALAWLVAHAAEYGGNSSQMFILGQSAGATHSASVIFDDRFSLPRGVKAAALSSGFYNAPIPLGSGEELYYGKDLHCWDDRAPFIHVRSTQMPIMLGLTEFDPSTVAEQTSLMAQALNKKSTIADGQLICES